ncbi:4'-phosphopantetheinyl transferase superfamily protein [Bizionia echini]|uniref:4'-phosphopantetheinyl transferase superfamily protein n=1 Tax=Bizionia echini TaxID=649333 RepID=UPI0030D6D64B
MIGNDIIDLNETKRTTNWKRPGFLKKLFTETEQHIIAYSEDPFTTVWQLWSMKESAYKVFIQTGGKPFYNPRRLACNLKADHGEVLIESMLLKTDTIINANYIFSVAKKRETTAKNGIFKLDGLDIKKQSDVLKQQFLKVISVENNLNVHALAIRKSETGVPKLFNKNTKINVAFSLSHHGKYASYSILN